MLSKTFSLSSVSSIIVCLSASVSNTNCDLGGEFDDFKIKWLACPFEFVSPGLCFTHTSVDTPSYIYLTGRQMTFIFQYNSRHFNQVLLNHILVTPLCVQLCHQSFVDALPLKWRLLPLHQKMTFHKLLFNFWMVNDGGFWVKQQPELTNEKQAIFLQEDAAPVFVGSSHLYNKQEFARCLSQVG